MRDGLSMKSRAEVTTRYAKAYARAGKKDKGKVLDEVVSVTGWTRDNARRRLVAAARRSPGAGRQVAKAPRKPRALKYSYDTVKVLQRVWAASGGQCGKYLAASMRIQLDLLEAHGELVDGADRYSPGVREAGDEVEAEPGFFEGDTVSHCGPTLKGEFARTLHLDPPVNLGLGSGS